MEVTSKASEVVVVVGEEGDVELSLGLSLGGRSTGNKTMSPTVNGGILSNGTGDFDGVIAGEINSFVKSGVVSAEGVREKMDLVRKRETCSPQRHRKKREEKRQKVAENKVSDYRVESNYKPNPNPNPKPNDDMNPKQSPDPETKSSNTSTAATVVNQNHGLPPYGAFPMIPMQYPLTQCISYPFPYGVPWLNMNPNIPVSSGKDVTAARRNVFQPVPSRSFLPFHEQQVANGTASFRGEEVNGGGINRNHSLTASQGSSFSTVSEYQSTSIQGGSSSSNETRTDSTNHAPREKTQLSSFSKLDELSQKSSLNYSPNQSEALGQVNVEQTGNKLISNSKKSSPSSNTMPEAVPELKSDEATPPAKKHILTNNQPKPISPALPEMPCVSTTGDGPNGKKITGLLYRYSKTEVSIVCVCHGTFFSPAEFIKHAGGREVSHPLRHIIVVPS